MTINISKPEVEEISAEPALTSLQEIAETIQLDALQEARSKITQPIRAADLQELLKWHEFVDYYRLALADRIARTLTAHDTNITAVYYFDPNLNPDGETETYLPVDPSINLLIEVETPSAALEAFISALDREMAAQARTLPSRFFDSLQTILNGIVCTSEDIKEKNGYAALLSSYYLRPRRLC